ncbi:TetR/AcrR family transcriptional regulator [Nocardia flavorosea]|uniref:TetR/AcrR family transcriptional regulator n=1 Tax=Nocardia flavorosea TaxID=53429 RepID=A0A846YHS3_9NOCA|nr:TetR/AcrR family transcriptional regulator [Nocardia flavorosea]NKY58597.1 TetR/AcrR family transcriptional regulator [Nocardia flavorosea]
MTAEERGAQVLEAAVAAFAESGYAATRTDEIARRAGVSQPYVIRLFGSKQRLFLAAVDQVCDRIEEAFTDAAEAAGPDAALDALSQGYHRLLTDRSLLLVLLHAFAAAGNPDIGPVIRDRYGRIYHLIRELTGAPVAESRRFLATGMLLTVMAALRVTGPDAIAADWAEDMLTDLYQNGM